MARYQRKPDLPWPDMTSDDVYYIVKYQDDDDANLYLVGNPKKLNCQHGDRIVVTYSKNGDNDNHLPFSVCQIVSVVTASYLSVAKVLGLDIDETVARYHGETVVLDIDRPDTEQGDGIFIPFVPGAAGGPGDNPGDSGDGDSGQGQAQNDGQSIDDIMESDDDGQDKSDDEDKDGQDKSQSKDDKSKDKKSDSQKDKDGRQDNRRPFDDKPSEVRTGKQFVFRRFRLPKHKKG